MRFLTLVFILTVINYSKQQTPPQLADNVEGIAEQCIKSTNADPVIIENAFKEGKFVEDKNFKCFVKCMFVQLGDMTEDGKLSIDKMKAHAPAGVSGDQANKIIETCKDSTGSDPCDIAYNAAKCMVDEAVKLFGSG